MAATSEPDQVDTHRPSLLIHHTPPTVGELARQDKKGAM